MMSSYQTGVRLGRTIPTVRHWPTESAIESSPIVGREEVEVIIERRLGLVFDKLHDCVDCIEPVRIDE